MNSTKKIVWILAVGALGALIGAAACRWHVERSEQIQFEAHMLSGTSAMQVGNVEDAMFHWHVAIAINERRYSPYLNLAKMYAQQGRPDLARKMFEQALAHTDYAQVGVNGPVDEHVIQADRRSIQDELLRLSEGKQEGKQGTDNNNP